MRFRVPIYIAQEKRGYVARPLFLPGPVLRDDHLNRLLTKLTREFVKAIEEAAKADRQDDAARWAFNPLLTQHRLPLALHLRRRIAKVKYLFVVFKHLDRRLGFTPALPDVWFEIGRGERLESRAQQVLEDHWRNEERDADDGETIRPESDTLTGKAWVQALEVSAQPAAMRIAPEKQFFLMFGGGDVPEGASELRRVGRCLDWLFPDELDRAVLREEEVVELNRLLAAPERRPVLLVGPRQAGKTAVIHECVYRRVAERKAVHVQKENVWLLSPQRLISGMSYVGQWEGRLLAILKHAKKRDHVLYFDDLVGLFLAGLTSQSGLSAAMVLKPHLEERAVRVLGEITPEALRVLRERDRGFADLFHIVPVREPTDAATLRILIENQRRLEGTHACSFDLDVMPMVIDLQRRYERSTAFPGKAATALTRLAVRAAATAKEEKPLPKDPLVVRPRIARADVLDDFAAKSGLSLQLLDPRTRLDRDEVRNQLREQIVGQEEAVEALADVVSIAKARLNDPDRPLAAFLFVGPTGVGKTESAKAIARTLFGTTDRMLRIDLNEYNQPGAAAKLVGTLSQPEGLLTAAIRRQPFAVVLLDEVEKADPAVFDVLLQVLGEGRLTDALGRTADFTNAIIILTSNLGVRAAEGRLGFDVAGQGGAIFTRAAERFFRPEFFNRLDRIILFRKLSHGEMGWIARRLVDSVLAREGFAQRQCVLNVTPAALERVIESGYDPALGARAMKRAVERELTQPAAVQLAAIVPSELTIVTVRAAAPGLAIDVCAPGWATRLPLPAARPTAERLARCRQSLRQITDQLNTERPAGPLSARAITPAQERYFTLKELAGNIANDLECLAEELASRHRFTIEAGQPEKLGRKSRFRAIKNFRGHDVAKQPFSSLLAAVAMEEALRDLLDNAEPIDEDHELFDLENRLALLRLSTNTKADDRPTYLWVRGFPGSAANGPVDTVASLYRRAWNDALGVELTPARLPGLPTSDSAFEVKGIPARALATSEVGTHLVMPKHGGPCPVRVAALDRWPAERDETFGPVLRLYVEGQPICDVRTGLVAPPPYTPDLLRAFTLAALPREEL